MSHKLDKAARRKAKLKAKKAHAEQFRQQHHVRIAAAQILSKRKRLGLSQVKFAAALGVSVKKVSAWEHGKALPDEATLEKINGLWR